MILIDGVRYRLWVPEKEVEEFHPIIKEHYKDIFGDNTIFIEGSKLKAETGIGSVPDGFVIEISKRPKWYIIEIELSTHELYNHIVNQVGRFITGVKNTETQQKIIENIYNYLEDNKILKAKFEEITKTGEIHKYISDLIKKPPILVIVIEERTKGLDEALNLLKYSPIKVVVFQTYLREDAKKVHAHLFGPTNPIQEKIPIRPDFLLKLKDVIDRDYTTMRAEEPTDHYLRLQSDIYGVHFEFWYWREDQLSIDLHFERDHFSANNRLLSEVLKHKSNIEKELGQRLHVGSPWYKKWARIYILPDINSSEQAVQEMEKFRKILLPIIETIK
jgi:uncharacterized protein YuzB (UPF0349 family)